MIEEDTDEYPDGRDLRDLQERELALSHSLTTAEFALAHEAAVIGRVFAAARINFDAHTLVALRVFEGVAREAAEEVEAVAALQSAELHDLIMRSTRLAATLLSTSP